MSPTRKKRSDRRTTNDYMKIPTGAGRWDNESYSHGAPGQKYYRRLREEAYRSRTLG